MSSEIEPLIKHEQFEKRMMDIVMPNNYIVALKFNNEKSK